MRRLPATSQDQSQPPLTKWNVGSIHKIDPISYLTLQTTVLLHGVHSFLEAHAVRPSVIAIDRIMYFIEPVL